MRSKTREEVTNRPLLRARCIPCARDALGYGPKQFVWYGRSQLQVALPAIPFGHERINVIRRPKIEPCFAIEGTTQDTEIKAWVRVSLEAGWRLRSAMLPARQQPHDNVAAVRYGEHEQELASQLASLAIGVETAMMMYFTGPHRRMPINSMTSRRWR
ncbi:MAG: hypothetical protein KF790_02110 [Steroidobacteraceae bacterium]|nr:hypothetical protein [Steroidobacteraceae bacterium]